MVHMVPVEMMCLSLAQCGPGVNSVLTGRMMQEELESWEAWLKELKARREAEC